MVGGVVASFAIGNVASGTSGLFACSSLMVRGAKLYGVIDTAAGMVSAGQHLANGQAGVSDVLAFAPAISFGVQKLRGLPTQCFIGGTEVLTGSASEQGVFSETKIEDIQVGDSVWAKDENDPDGEMVLKKVTQLFRKTAYNLQKVTVTDDIGHTETLNVTDQHPFWVGGRGWTGAVSLVVGDKLVSSDGRNLTVTLNENDYRPDGVTVYNFEVEDAHTFFVADGVGMMRLFRRITSAILQKEKSQHMPTLTLDLLEMTIYLGTSYYNTRG